MQFTCFDILKSGDSEMIGNDYADLRSEMALVDRSQELNNDLLQFKNEYKKKQIFDADDVKIKEIIKEEAVIQCRIALDKEGDEEGDAPKEIKIEEEVLIVPDESSLEPEQNPRISQMPIQNQQKESDPRISSEKSDVTEKTRFVTARET